MSLEPPFAAGTERPSLNAAAGAYVVTTDGRRVLDFASGGVAPLGHDVGLSRQALNLPQGFANPAEAELRAKLCENSFADQVRFSGSAAEAVELALTAMWKFQEAKRQPKRRRIVTLKDGYHGNTPLLELAGGATKLAGPLDALGSYFDQGTFNDVASVQASAGGMTAGILVEPVQRNGTFEPPQNGFLMGIRSLADEYDLVLAYDESVCGLGRTGALWAHEQSGAAPDIMILGNNLAGGLPFGALLMSERIAKVLGADEEAAHPLAVAAANATLDTLLAPGFLGEVEARSWAFEDQLYWVCRNHAGVVEARYGMGLWQTLKLRVPASEMQKVLWQHGLATVAGQGNCLGLLPPLTVTEEQIKEAVAALNGACASVAPVG